MRLIETMDLVAQQAESQWGYIHRVQVVQQMVTDIDLLRACRSGMLVSCGHGVYRVHGAPPHPNPEIWEPYLRLYAEGFEPRACRRSAAALIGLGSLIPEPAQFEVAAQASNLDRQDMRLYPESNVDPIQRHGIWCSHPKRIIADLLADWEDLGHVGEVAADALRLGLMSRPELEQVLAPWTRRANLRHGDGIGMASYLLSQAGWQM